MNTQLPCGSRFLLGIVAAHLLTALAVAAQRPLDLHSSNILVFSGTSAYTNYGASGRPVGSFSGRFRFATDSKQWNLEFQSDNGRLPAEQSATYDGHALYTLYRDLPKGKEFESDAVIDLADVTLVDTPPLFAPANLPWFAAWSCGLISLSNTHVLPPWAHWPEASIYTNRITQGNQAGCASKKFEFIIRASQWQVLRRDPQRRNAIDNFDLTNDFTEGEFVVSACTNVFGVSVPLHVELSRVSPPHQGSRVRSVLMMNTTNAQQVAGTIDKPRFRKRTQVNDWRSMSATDTGLWIPMTRFVTYYVSNQWLETSSPEWSAMVLSNALAGARVASGVMGFRYAADSSGFMRIEEVLPDSPAQRAGLRPDDLVLSIDGKETRPQAGATCIIPGPPGSIAELIVVRNGETNTVPVRRTSLTDFLR